MRLFALPLLLAGSLVLAACDLLVGLAEAIPAPSQCSNTCQYAHDGECDDGGPGSLYSVCSFGTDCGDCGPRSSGTANPGPSTPQDATMQVWSSYSAGGSIVVSVGLYGGTLTQASSSAPPCPTHSPGRTVVATLSPGTHSITATATDGTRWSFQRTVQAGNCYNVELVMQAGAHGDAPGVEVRQSPLPYDVSTTAWSRPKRVGGRSLLPTDNPSLVALVQAVNLGRRCPPRAVPPVREAA